MNHVKRQTGFTLIELMLAMTFIAILLIAIAMTTIQISNIYNKGITLREVNQAGRALSDEFQRGVAGTAPFDVTPKLNDANPTTLRSKYVQRDGGGRLCLGSYTYVWNNGAALSGEKVIVNEYTDGQPVRFAKVQDAGGELCAVSTTKVNRDNATELLSTGDRDLVVHELTIVKTADDTSAGQALYTITFKLGTNDRQQLQASDASCRPPSDAVGDEDYCSVNQFEVIARAGNTSGGQ
jgi:type II secretory pathway pseudopilin PulG